MRLAIIVYISVVLICFCQAIKPKKTRIKKCSTNKAFGSGSFNLFGVRTLYKNYERVFGSASIQRPKPKTGCAPVHIYLLLRHGARYPYRDTLKTQKKLLRLTKLLNSTGRATLCPRDLQRLHVWEPWVNKYVNKNQTLYGDDEVRNISRRFATSFPELFPFEAQARDYRFRSSDYQRNIASMRVFAEEMFKRGRNGADTVEEVVENAGFQVVPIRQDNLLRALRNCKNYLSDNARNSARITPFKAFLKGKLVQRMLRSVTSRLGIRRGTLTGKDLYDAYLDGCSLQQWVDTVNGPWCFPFSKKDLQEPNDEQNSNQISVSPL